jgi:hypothetical protein
MGRLFSILSIAATLFPIGLAASEVAASKPVKQSVTSSWVASVDLRTVRLDLFANGHCRIDAINPMFPGSSVLPCLWREGSPDSLILNTARDGAPAAEFRLVDDGAAIELVNAPMPFVMRRVR